MIDDLLPRHTEADRRSGPQVVVFSLNKAASYPIRSSCRIWFQQYAVGILLLVHTLEKVL